MNPDDERRVSLADFVLRVTSLLMKKRILDERLLRRHMNTDIQFVKFWCVFTVTL